MPSSSDHEPNTSSVLNTVTQPQAQRRTSASPANIPSKKDKKNGAAKDSNTAAAAVTKLGPKMPDSSRIAKSPIQSETSSPKTKPVPVIPNGTIITSPLLGALPSNAFNTNQNTTEWARNIPAYSGSPGNLISLSDSPPTQPSSYDDRSTLAGWSQRERFPSNSRLPSTSPPYYQPRRPQSFQIDGHLDDLSPQRPSAMFRRPSVYSQHSQRYPAHPPLPHQPQAHFYGAPDIDLGLPQASSGLTPGSRGFYCGFDTLEIYKSGSTHHHQNVIISCYEGGLDVFEISKGSLDRLASLDGLRGGVYAAKILPWHITGSAANSFPLIALVVHGPTSQSTEAHNDNISLPSDTASSTKAESVTDSPRGYPLSSGEIPVGGLTHFHTTVEVYSLKTKKYVTTLLSTPKVPLAVPVTSPLYVSPPPVGALNIAADAGNIVITSGTTGELWIFRQEISGIDAGLHFLCVGKLWTTVQQNLAPDTSRPDSSGSESSWKEATTPLTSKSALIALKGRWLVYSPSATSSQISIRAVVPSMPSSARIPGLNSFAPPQPPLINCAVDMPEGDEFWGRLRRQAAQEAIKGAKWVGDQGARAWNNYWNKSSSPPSQPTGAWTSTQQRYEGDFPPTHGAEVTPSTNIDPTLLTVIDIDRLAQLGTNSSVGNHVLATFKVPLGCSFVSFSPNGLSLFTASSKGDVQFILDLMRIQYTRSSAFQLQNPAVIQGQHVRQVAIFTRLTVARIVDVVWNANGSQIAMITERNTVHFLELPPSAFVWPPYRRRIKLSQKRLSQGGEDAATNPTATELASNAVNAVWNFAQPFMTRPRGFSGPVGAGSLAGSIAATAGQGGKALASTISKSFGAATGTIENFRKSGEHRLHLPHGSTLATKGCVKWLEPPFKDSFAALVDGIVMIHTIRNVNPKSQGQKPKLHISARHQDYKLPSIPDYIIAPALLRAIDIEEELDLAQKEIEAPQSRFKRSSTLKANCLSGTESSIPQAEIESNAPYQPFHTDQRVNLQIYSTTTTELPSPTVSALLSSAREPREIPSVPDSHWVFGRPITTTKLDVGVDRLEKEVLDALDEHQPLPRTVMERVTTRITEADEAVEQIVITTRRRHGAVEQSGDEEGFFEDDCEVLDYANQRV